METQNFEKKGCLSSEKNILAYIARSIKNDIYQETFLKGPKSILAITVKAIRSIL